MKIEQIGLIALIGFGVYKLMNKPKAQKAVYKDFTYNPANFPLKKGSVNNEVKALQLFLNWSSNFGLNPNGQFGSATLDAVKQETGSDKIDLAYFKNFVIPFAVDKQMFT